MTTIVYSYKMVADSGFAPNPFFGLLTLATCKASFRRARSQNDIGVWVAGFTSKKLCGDPVGCERLVVLFEISEIVSVADYYYDRRFRRKIPTMEHTQIVHRTGDNIYKPISSGAEGVQDFEQIKNPHHDVSSMKDDLSGRNVLIARRFFYFGRDAKILDHTIRPNVPPKQSRFGRITKGGQADKFIRHIESSFAEGIHSAPHDWDENDESWKRQE